ncbi:AMP-dependent synthetase/ligase [Bacteroidota bacterium]
MRTLNTLFNDCVEKYRDNVYLLENSGDGYKPTTYLETRKEVHRFAGGLLSLGIKKGDRLTLLAEGRNKWFYSEMGILYTGAVNVPLSTRLEEPSEIKFRIEHSESRMIIISGREAHKIKDLKKDISCLEKIIYLDPQESYDEDELFFDDISAMGDKYLSDNQAEFDKIWQSIGENDLANICYTSGTTADPKGIMLSHRNYTANVEQAQGVMPVYDWWTTLVYIPWDHAFAHTAGVYTILSHGASMASVQLGKTQMEALKNFPINMKQISPVFLFSVPALAKNFKKNIENGIRQKGPVIDKLFHHAIKVSKRYIRMGHDRGKKGSFLLKPYIWLFDKIIFKKVREAFGGRLEFFVGGAALLDLELAKFFYAIGVPMFQGYGLTEAAPIISGNSQSHHKLGSSGRVVRDLEVKICDEDGKELPLGEKGEIVCRGENVMLGYWKNESATTETLKDGWLYTGDMGYLDSDNYLYVLGRFKSLLIADDGEKYSPEGIEEAFTEYVPFLEACMMYNNQNPYCTIFVVPNKDEMKRWLKEQNLDPASMEGKEAALKELERQISEFKTGGKFQDEFPQRWLPAAIGILPEPFSQENLQLNSMNKLVRNKVLDTYQDSLDFIYTPQAKDITNDKNLSALGDL